MVGHRWRGRKPGWREPPGYSVTKSLAASHRRDTRTSAWTTRSESTSAARRRRSWPSRRKAASLLEQWRRPRTPRGGITWHTHFPRSSRRLTDHCGGRVSPHRVFHLRMDGRSRRCPSGCPGSKVSTGRASSGTSCLVPVVNDAQGALLGETWLGSARGSRDAILLTPGYRRRGSHSGRRPAPAREDRPGGTSRSRHARSRRPGRHLPNARQSRGRHRRLHDPRADRRPVQDDEGAGQRRRVGDAEARRVWRRSIRLLAIAIASFVNVLDPEIVVIGAGSPSQDLRCSVRFVATWPSSNGGPVARVWQCCRRDLAIARVRSVPRDTEWRRGLISVYLSLQSAVCSLQSTVCGLRSAGSETGHGSTV